MIELWGPGLLYTQLRVQSKYLNLLRRGYSSDFKYDVVQINKVHNIKIKCTIKEYSDACEAQSIQDIIGQPST